ncbi:MAG: hypothetical protein IH899_00590 [Planctomycetes bacterium]|nr:hypothetical protein [Planctomycetota bacterium]
MADEQDVEEAKVLLTVTPDDPLFVVSLSGVRSAVTGNDEEDLETTISFAPFAVYQRLVIGQKTRISAIQLRLKKSDSVVTMRYKVALFESHGIYPNTAQAIVEYDRAVQSDGTAIADADSNFTFDGNELGITTFRTIEFTSSKGIVEVLGPAVYWIKIETTVASAGNGLVLSRGTAKTFNNIVFSVFGFDVEKPLWMRALHEKLGPVQDEADLLNAGLGETGKEAEYSGIRLNFATPMVVERLEDLAENRYHCTATIRNGTKSPAVVGAAKRMPPAQKGAQYQSGTSRRSLACA